MPAASLRMLLDEAVEEVLAAALDPGVREALRRASLNALEAIPRAERRAGALVEELRSRVRRAKEEVAARLDYYVEEAAASLRRVGARPVLVREPREAVEYVAGLAGRGPVVFSKSMVAEELGLRRGLQERGVEVWETDLGELLVQLSGGKPMHAIAPAVHLTREEAARLVREKLGAPLPGDARPEEIVAAVRRFLREKFIRATLGVSGANALAADTGAIVLVENEGNIRLVTGLPPVHVAVAGVDKIVPSIEDAFAVALLQAINAGLYPPTYINVIAGPSSTADIEHHRVRGAHGPRELHVLLVDNGRRRAAETWLRDTLRCIRCGRCQWECPVWRVAGNHWGGRVYGGPMGVLWTAVTEGMERAAALAQLCLGCRACDAVCPMQIPLSSAIHRLKSLAAGEASGHR